MTELISVVVGIGIGWVLSQQSISHFAKGYEAKTGEKLLDTTPKLVLSSYRREEEEEEKYFAELEEKYPIKNRWDD